MLILDKYYQIIEKESKLVSYSWKVYHILTLLGATIASFLVVFYFQDILEAFGNNCVIDATLTFKNDSHYNYIGNFALNNSFHNPLTIWGNKLACDSCLFTFIFFAVIGLILIAFFFIIPKGGAVQDNELYIKPWRIVFPSVLIAVIATVSTFVYYVKLSKGIKGFCAQFDELAHDESCGEDINLYTLIYYETEIDVYKYVRIVNRGSLFVVIFWVLFLVSLILRILRGADFNIVVYNLGKMKKQEVHLDTSTESLSEMVMEPSRETPTIVIHATAEQMDNGARKPTPVDV